VDAGVHFCPALFYFEGWLLSKDSRFGTKQSWPKQGNLLAFNHQKRIEKKKLLRVTCGQAKILTMHPLNTTFKHYLHTKLISWLQEV
jgi:hypothetical protein